MELDGFDWISSKYICIVIVKNDEMMIFLWKMLNVRGIIFMFTEENDSLPPFCGHGSCLPRVLALLCFGSLFVPNLDDEDR